MEKPIQEIQYKGKNIEIYYDYDSESPRNWDNLGTCYCSHRNYNLSDGDNLAVEDIMEIFNNKNEYISLPIFLYDHAGITISTFYTYPYNDQWDAGMVGIIAVSKEKVRKWYSRKNISKKLFDTVLDVLRNEIDTYDQYLRGEVFGYVIDEGESLHDSCWGYYDPKDAIEEAKSVIEYKEKETRKNHFAKVKAYIKNQVPLTHRISYSF